MGDREALGSRPIYLAYIAISVSWQFVLPLYESSTACPTRVLLNQMFQLVGLKLNTGGSVAM
ncbi:hypothetical protein EON65_30420 [archaeon]|nr:MAG: hypothetical protein EON65_30420 [archaeon]